MSRERGFHCGAPFDVFSPHPDALTTTTHDHDSGLPRDPPRPRRHRRLLPRDRSASGSGSRGASASSGDYFLGARDLPAWAVLLSIVATETSAVTVISTPALGARGDLTFLQLPDRLPDRSLGVSLWLLPGYFRGEQETAYARLETRFGPATRRALSLVFLSRASSAMACGSLRARFRSRCSPTGASPPRSS